MTEITHQAVDYRITFETFNGFFGAWLKRNLFTRRRLVVTLILAAVLLVISVVTCWQLFAVMVAEPNMPLLFKALTLSVMAVMGLILYFLMAAIPVYILSPILSYLWLVVIFTIGPVRKRINSAEVSQQGISKSYEQHSHITPWGTIYDLVETRKSLLVFTNRNCAMMIPKAGFTTPDQADAFWSATKNYWQQARAVTSSGN